MKKILPVVLSFALLICCFAGCGTTQGSDSLSIVCTVFPVYDWMRELTDGIDGIRLTLIADNGADMHSYQPTTGDIVEIASCDMFVYVGGQSEQWVREVLEQSDSESRVELDLLTALGDRAIELSGHDHTHDHDHGEDGHECVYDEHFWLSAVNAQVLCEFLCAQLAALDSDNAERYRANAQTYIERLSALDAEYRNAAESAAVRTLLFADRFPFRYLTAEYGIDYHAAFDGCSAESEASFETVAYLSSALDEHELNAVLIIEGSDESLARTVIEGSKNGGCEVLTLDSMQSVTSAQIADGVTYTAVMEENLEVLRQALGCE